MQNPSFGLSDGFLCDLAHWIAIFVYHDLFLSLVLFSYLTDLSDIIYGDNEQEQHVVQRNTYLISLKLLKKI